MKIKFHFLKEINKKKKFKNYRWLETSIFFEFSSILTKNYTYIFSEILHFFIWLEIFHEYLKWIKNEISGKYLEERSCFSLKNPLGSSYGQINRFQSKNKHFFTSRILLFIIINELTFKHRRLICCMGDHVKTKFVLFLLLIKPTFYYFFFSI